MRRGVEEGVEIQKGRKGRREVRRGWSRTRGKGRGDREKRQRVRESELANSPFYSESGIPGYCQVTGTEHRRNADRHFMTISS